MAHDKCDHDDDCEVGIDNFDMHDDPAVREVVDRENATLREIFKGFENISTNSLYILMEVIYISSQISAIDGRKSQDKDIIEFSIDSLFTILVRLTEDFPEPEKTKIRKLLIDDEFLDDAQELWDNMLDSLQENIH